MCGATLLASSSQGRLGSLGGRARLPRLLGAAVFGGGGEETGPPLSKSSTSAKARTRGSAGGSPARPGRISAGHGRAACLPPPRRHRRYASASLPHALHARPPRSLGGQRPFLAPSRRPRPQQAARPRGTPALTAWLPGRAGASRTPSVPPCLPASRQAPARLPPAGPALTVGDFSPHLVLVHDRVFRDRQLGRLLLARHGRTETRFRRRRLAKQALLPLAPRARVVSAASSAAASSLRRPTARQAGGREGVRARGLCARHSGEVSPPPSATENYNSHQGASPASHRRSVSYDGKTVKAGDHKRRTFLT